MYVLQETKFSKFTSLLFVLPYLVVFVAFMLIPLIFGAYISFHDWDLLGSTHKFVGFGNYAKLFDPSTYFYSVFMNGLWNTIKFVIFSVPLLVVGGLLLALLVQHLPDRFKGIFRTIFFISYAISVSVIAVLWLWLLDTNSGLFNHLLAKVGAAPVQWLTSMPYAWISIVAATVWWTVGFNMIIYINALNEVPDELYEAGSVDGATPWQKFWSITLPSIRPVMVFTIVTSTIASFNIYGQPYLMTRGGPGTSTKVLLMEIVDQAFVQRQLGIASAMAIVMALIMIVISVIQFRLTRSNEGNEA
ncbi:sugar ABC transporter permease [Fictibacillus enclensis]|nr:sugar ABC transporter permease [Fictibacillus enclensis]MDM5199332.1 sugar ABC transporter permease [Fictibacillus enclensis]